MKTFIIPDISPDKDLQYSLKAPSRTMVVFYVLQTMLNNFNNRISRIRARDEEEQESGFRNFEKTIILTLMAFWLMSFILLLYLKVFNIIGEFTHFIMLLIAVILIPIAPSVAFYYHRRKKYEEAMKNIKTHFNNRKERVEDAGELLRLQQFYIPFGLIYLNKNQAMIVNLILNDKKYFIETVTYNKNEFSQSNQNKYSSEICEELRKIKKILDQLALLKKEELYVPITNKEKTQYCDMLRKIIDHAQPYRVSQNSLIFCGERKVASLSSLQKCFKFKHLLKFQEHYRSLPHLCIKINDLETQMAQSTIPAKDALREIISDKPDDTDEAKDYKYKFSKDTFNITNGRPDLKPLLEKIGERNNELNNHIKEGIEQEERKKFENRLIDLEAEMNPWMDPKKLQEIILNYKKIDDFSSEIKEILSELRNKKSYLNKKEMLSQVMSQVSQIQPTSQNIYSNLINHFTTIQSDISKLSSTLEILSTKIEHQQHVSPNVNEQTINKIIGNIASPFHSSISNKINTSLKQIERLQDNIRNFTSEARKEIKYIPTSTADIQKRLERINSLFNEGEYKLGSIAHNIEGVKDDILTVLLETRNTMKDLEEDLKKWRKAKQKYEQEKNKILQEREEIIQNKKKCAEDELKNLQNIKDEIKWTTQESPELIEHLTEVKIGSLQKSFAIPEKEHLYNKLYDKALKTPEEAKMSFTKQVNELRQIIKNTDEYVEQSVKIEQSICNDAALLLVPIWYVEWHEAGVLEKPYEKHYQLIQPSKAILNNKQIELKEQYSSLLNFLSDNGYLKAWTGTFRPNEVPCDYLSTSARPQHTLSEREIGELFEDINVCIEEDICSEKIAAILKSKT